MFVEDLMYTPRNMYLRTCTGVIFPLLLYLFISLQLSHSRASKSSRATQQERVKTFAEAQRAALTDVSVPIPGGHAGHTVSSMSVAGCYAPGGRYPLPSSVIMTAVTAKAAGVGHVVVASPRPAAATVAAAYVADADILLCVGGAQAVAAMAFG